MGVERVADWALGLTALGWVVRDVAQGGALHPVGATIALLNAAASLAFLSRRRATRRASWPADLGVLGSVASTGAVLALAPAPPSWPAWQQWSFAVAGLGALVCFLHLGRRFGVLPAWRGLARSGPYRLVRHPLYATELGMLLVCATAGRSAAAACVAALAVALLAVRIRLEERLLVGQRQYRAYARRVRWRLVPGLW